MKTVQIICPHNNAGLTRDRNIIKAVLEENGFEVTLSDSSKVKHEPFDIDIYVEHLLQINKKSKHRILIPNPEWFELEWKPKLQDITMVLAKTRDCQRIFKKLHPHVVFTSFTSLDRYLPDVKKKLSFFHSCGKSQSKGTDELIKLWTKIRKQPYPRLQLYARPEMLHWGAIKSGNLKNIDQHFTFVPEDEFRIAQNENRIHICTSLYEGFGHYINEAKSCGNIVITTNAPPMNELVSKEFGFLANNYQFATMRLAPIYKTGHRYIREQVDKVLNTNENTFIAMGQRARQSFLDNDLFFKTRFLTVINDLK